MMQTKTQDTCLSVQDVRLEATLLTSLHEQGIDFFRGTTEEDALRLPAGAPLRLLICELDSEGRGLPALLAIRHQFPDTNICVCSNAIPDNVLISLIDAGFDYFLDNDADAIDIQVMLAILEETRRPELAAKIIEARRGWYSMTIPATLDSIGRLRPFFIRLLRNNCPVPEMIPNIGTVVDELFANALEWGITQSRQFIRLSMLFAMKRTIIKIEDGGEGFDVEETLAELTSLDFDSLTAKRIEAGKRPGGFGLRLVQELSDKVIFNKKGNGVLISFEHER